MQWVVMVVNPDSQGGVVGGGDYESGMVSKDSVKTFHTRESSADQAAKKLATANPGKQYAVMGIKKIFETAKPVFIEKTVNDHGEIVVVSAPKAAP